MNFLDATLNFQAIIDSGHPFEDPSFPPNIGSIFDPQDFSEDAETDKYVQLEWARAPEIFPNGFGVFPETPIDVNDIVQQGIGDCYFIACLSAIATKPHRIQKLFKTQFPNAAGCYVVQMCVNGTWTDVVLDDYLPVKPGTKTLAFGHSKSVNGQGVLWVSLLEKAWAKLNGNYDRIINGAADLGLMHMTGMPAIQYKHEDFRARKQEVWNRIVKARRDDHIMLAGINDKKAGIEQDLGQGLLSNHCYSILDLREIQAGGQAVKLLKLRNPLGRRAYTGPWSPTSAQWTPQVAKAMNFSEGETHSGTFCMTLEAFLAKFSNTFICKYNDDDKHTYAFRNCPVPQLNFFEFTLDESQTGLGLDILVNQMGERLKHRKRNDGSQFDPSWFSIVLSRKDPGHHPANTNLVTCNYHYVKASVSSNYQINLEVEPEKLLPGRYVVMVEALWNKCARDAQFQQFCVQIVSGFQLKLEESDISESSCHDFMQSTFLSKALQEKDQCQVQPSQARPGAFKLVQSSSYEVFYGIVAVVNESKQDWEQNFNFDKLIKFYLWGEYKGKPKFTLKVPVGQAKVILLHRDGEGKGTFGFQASMAKGSGGGGMGAFGGMMGGMGGMGGGMARGGMGGGSSMSSPVKQPTVRSPVKAPGRGQPLASAGKQMVSGNGRGNAAPARGAANKAPARGGGTMVGGRGAPAAGRGGANKAPIVRSGMTAARGTVVRGQPAAARGAPSMGRGRAQPSRPAPFTGGMGQMGMGLVPTQCEDDITMPPGPMSDSQAISQIQGNKRLKRKQCLKGAEIYLSELTIKEHVYLLFENESDEDYTCSLEFKIDGYMSDDLEGKTMEVEVAAGSQELRRLAPCQTDSNAARGQGMGGFNPMSMLMDAYEQAERFYSYKMTAFASG